MELPDMSLLDEMDQKETKLGNPALESYAEEVDDPVIDRTYAWSLKVNQDIGEMVYGMPPFPFVKESLEKMMTQSRYHGSFPNTC